MLFKQNTALPLTPTPAPIPPESHLFMLLVPYQGDPRAEDDADAWSLNPAQVLEKSGE